MRNPGRLDLENGCYHTISVTKGREPVFANPANAALLIDCIRSMSQLGQAHVLAYAVMPDHLHLLLSPRNGENLSNVMRSLKRYAVKRINEASGRTGSLWQQSFYDRAMRNEEHLYQTIEYIHKNPVVADLVTNEGEYPFSSALPGAWSDLERFLGA
jgi:REP element-mobilizing transposase RayT